jgi:nicotinamide-nucleotide amidase
MNPIGTAPGFYLDEGNLFIAALPGVPGELQAMFLNGLKPVLQERFSGKIFIRRKFLRTFGIGESKLNEAISDIMKKENPAIGLTAKETGVDIRIIAKAMSAEESQALLDRTDRAIRERLKDAVYGVDGQEMEEIIGALLAQRRLTLAVAESCTGGMIAARMTNISGSSEYFERGVVTYSNESKTEILGVPKELIEKHGAVSREVAAAMARGIKQSGRTDLGLAVTGIAGPTGGTKEKPVGLVYISLASAEGAKTDEYNFYGNRDQVRVQAAQTALDMVRRHLIG